MNRPAAARPEVPKVDLSERGASVNDAPQTSERRLFCQLQVFTNCTNAAAVREAFQASGLEGVIYLDTNDPYGIAVLSLTENPADFTERIRDFFQAPEFSQLIHKKELTMIGRTYSSGREKNLEDWLIQKPRRNTLNPDYPWAVWYPLRRKAEFELLTPQEKGKILMEHSLIGRSYAEAGHALDIRLACQGLDKNDNDFVIGIVSPELHALSKLVQNMRQTQQTAKYLASLGPFFVGRTYYQTPLS